LATDPQQLVMENPALRRSASFQMISTREKGKYRVRRAVGAQEVAAAQRLRAICFNLGCPRDSDAFDDRYVHMLIEDRTSGALVCCYRLFPVCRAEIAESYAAHFYDLSPLSHYSGLMLELGRFCIHPASHDPDILRIAWATLTDLVDRNAVRMLFGCSSFAGVDPGAHLSAFSLLAAQHLAPAPWRPRIKAAEIHHFEVDAPERLELRKAMVGMPPLLRTYLLMGGWVSDHAVIDRQMNTLHVFTGLEIDAIPENRKRLLRALV